MSDLITTYLHDDYTINELTRELEESKAIAHKELMIAFRYGIKVCEQQPGKDECKEKYLDRAIAVINRLRKKDYKYLVVYDDGGNTASITEAYYNKLRLTNKAIPMTHNWIERLINRNGDTIAFKRKAN